MFDLIEKEDIIHKICHLHNVKRLEVFGSAVSENYSDDSDVDFIVEFTKSAKPNLFNNYFGLKFQLEKLFNRNVDVVMKSAIKNPYFKRGIESKKLLYEEKDK